MHLKKEGGICVRGKTIAYRVLAGHYSYVYTRASSEQRANAATMSNEGQRLTGSIAELETVECGKKLSI